MDRQEGTYQYHTSCIECDSSDAMAVYRKEIDGEVIYDAYCWSCGTKFSPEQVEEAGVEQTEVVRVENIITQEQIKEIQSKDIRGWRERKIKKSTCERYGVYTDFNEDDTVRYRYYPSTEGGELVGYHVRDDKVKQAKKYDKSIKTQPFFPIGKVKTSCELFGQSLFPKNGKYLVITGGEEDTMAVYQSLKKSNYETPVISPTCGETGAFRQIQSNFAYINSYEKIVLMLDNDKAGREASDKIAKLFGAGKCSIANLSYKDPCEYLQVPDGETQLRSAFWSAMPKKPSQVLTVGDIYERALAMPELGLSFPWPSATKATLGIRRGEIHIVGAAPKIGKTEHQHQLIKHMTDVHGVKVGVMSLEENPVKTLKKVAGKYARKQFTKPPEIGGYTPEELESAISTLDGKMEFYSSDGVRDYQEILSTIRYWASNGIWFFIIDPLTALVAEYHSGEANDILNNFMSKAASLCMELQVTMFMYSHVNPVKSGVPHDQGGDVLSSQFTGSRAMEKWAHYGWGIQRDRSEKDEMKRNTARITMLFDREFGEYCEYYAFYNKHTNDWSEVEAPDGADDKPISEFENDIGMSFSEVDNIPETEDFDEQPTKSGSEIY